MGTIEEDQHTGVLGRDLGVPKPPALPVGGVPLPSLGVKLPLLLALRVLMGLRTLHMHSC